MSITNVYPIDKYFKRNTFAISSTEFFWGLALPVIIESTFLQIFLKQIGASNRIIGMIPSILALGMTLFGLVSAFLTSHLIHKKRAVIIAHIVPSIPILLAGLLIPVIDPVWRVEFFVMCYILFSLSIGITVPLWQNFTVKIFSPGRTVKAISIMMIVQICARLMGSFFIFRTVEKYAFSIESTSYVFIAAAAMFFTGSFFYLIAREHDGETLPVQKDAHNIKTMSVAIRGVIKDKNFILYLLGNTEMYATISAISFYANYAIEFYGIEKAAAAGLFVGATYTAGIISTFFLGWMDVLPLKYKFITARLSAISGTIILLNAASLPWFLSVSFLFGTARGILQFGHAPAVKRLSGLDDATDYFAMANVLVLPMSMGIPYLSGFAIDNMAEQGAFAYKAVFIVLAFLQSVGLICTLLTDFSDKNHHGPASKDEQPGMLFV